jgi:hypothetical protein
MHFRLPTPICTYRYTQKSVHHCHRSGYTRGAIGGSAIGDRGSARCCCGDTTVKNSSAESHPYSLRGSDLPFPLGHTEDASRYLKEEGRREVRAENDFAVLKGWQLGRGGGSMCREITGPPVLVARVLLPCSLRAYGRRFQVPIIDGRVCGM